MPIRTRARDNASLAREALAHADTLHNLARHLTRSPTDAEDLVQETYLRALQALHQFAPGTNLKAWLFRILRNTHLSGHRDGRRRPAEPPVSPEAASDPPLRGSWIGGDFALEQARRGVGSDIEAAMRTLTEDARTAILLDLEGLSEAEMALVLGCAAGTVKSRLARARAGLREKLSDYALDRKLP